MGLGVPESTLVEYQVDLFDVSSKEKQFSLYLKKNKFHIPLYLQDAFASFDKGGNGMVPTKVNYC